MLATAGQSRSDLHFEVIEVMQEDRLLRAIIVEHVENGLDRRLCVGAGEDEGSGHVVLWVSDEGPGIAPGKIEHIFEAFRRGDVHGQPGVGLGLAIASQAANLLGAKLAVASRPGAGARFSLHLPTGRVPVLSLS